MSGRRPRITVLYHYLHPDDVVSARHFDGLCEGLVERGWDVEAMPCNRGCRDESRSYPLREDWGAVRIRRVWRPAFPQASTLGRLANAGWMIAAWSALGLRRGPSRPDVVLTGTDPVMSVVVAAAIKRVRPGLPVAHWAYDLYPEAAVADGVLRANSAAARVTTQLVKRGYRCCDVVADLGPCMRARIDRYGHAARKVTIVPWALAEPAEPTPPDPAMRRQLFGDASLGVLYSGNFGRAHSHAALLALARRLRGEGIHFCFAVRGNRADELRAAVGPDDTNVSFAGFCSESELAARLGAADIHMASLRPEWEGIVVPSKFFGSLAAGRPVLFSGPAGSTVARAIDEHGVGWHLSNDRVDDVASALRDVARDQSALQAMQLRCHAVYQGLFARAQGIARWDRELRALLARSRGSHPRHTA